MIMPQHLEGIAQDRMRDWEKDMKFRRLLAERPQKPPRWRRWTGNTLMWIGALSLRWGKRMAQRESQEGVTSQELCVVSVTIVP